MPFEFDFKDPKNQKIIAAFMIVVVILYGSFNFVVKPVAEELRIRHAEAMELQGKIDSILRILQEPQKIEELNKMFTAQLAELDAVLPTTEAIPELLDQFSIIERETRVHLMGFDAMDRIDDGTRPYVAHRYNIKLEAGYHQFGNFLSRLAMLPRLLSISDLKISVNPFAQSQETYNGLEDMPRNLSIEFTLTSYVFRPERAL